MGGEPDDAHHVVLGAVHPVGDLETGKPAPVTVLREGRTVDLTVTLEEPRRARREIRRKRPVS